MVLEAASFIAGGPLATALDVMDLFNLASALGKGSYTIRPPADPRDTTPTPELNRQIWKARADLRAQIERRVQRAVATKQTPEALARDMEIYLRAKYRPTRDARGRLTPNQKPGTITSAGRGQGSYYARRLARTEITRANADGAALAFEKDPFAVGVRWKPAHRHTGSEPCMVNQRLGVYDPRFGPRPPAHPFCLCRLEIVRRPNKRSRAFAEHAMAGPGEKIPRQYQLKKRLSECVTRQDFERYIEQMEVRIRDGFKADEARVAMVQAVRARDALLRGVAVPAPLPTVDPRVVRSNAVEWTIAEGVPPAVRALPEIIDTVHRRIGDLAPVNVIYQPELRSSASYAFWDNTIQLGPVVSSETAKLGAVLHEYGHHLDYKVFGSTPSHTVRQADAATWSGDVWKKKPYELSGPEAAYRKAVESSDTYKVWGKEDAARGYPYYAQPNEVFARSYVQYIAIRSQNPDLLAYLRQSQKRDPDFTHFAWTDEDFAPIGKALDDLFASRGMPVTDHAPAPKPAPAPAGPVPKKYQLKKKLADLRTRADFTDYAGKMELRIRDGFKVEDARSAIEQAAAKYARLFPDDLTPAWALRGGAAPTPPPSPPPPAPTPTPTGGPKPNDAPLPHKPVMDPQTAKAWASQSTIKVPVYHTAPNQSAMDSILSDGMRMGDGEHNYWTRGKGLYFTESREAAANYGKHTVEVYVNVRKIATAVQFDEVAARMNFTRLRTEKNRIRYGETTAADVTAELQRMGYDGVRHTDVDLLGTPIGEELVVFDPKNVVVVNPKLVPTVWKPRRPIADVTDPFELQKIGQDVSDALAAKLITFDEYTILMREIGRRMTIIAAKPAPWRPSKPVFEITDFDDARIISEEISKALKDKRLTYDEYAVYMDELRTRMNALRATFVDGPYTKQDIGSGETRKIFHEGFNEIPHLVKQLDAAVNSVHLSPLPSKANQIHTRYFTAAETKKEVALGMYSEKGGDGNNPMIRIKQGGQHELMTMVHEYAHYLDYRVLGFRTSPGSPRSGLTYGHNISAKMAVSDWRDAVHKSEAYKSLAAAKTKFGADKKWLDYAMTDVELFARSYTQWIAIRSKNPLLLRELDESRRSYNQYLGGKQQWDDADFTPIAKAFDKLFQERGLMKAAPAPPPPAPRVARPDFTEVQQRKTDLFVGRPNHTLVEKEMARRMAGDERLRAAWQKLNPTITPRNSAEWESIMQEEANDLKLLWEKTSGDSDPRAIAVQLAAKEEFGLDQARIWYDASAVDAARRQYGDAIPYYREVHRIQYEWTQEELKKAGLDEVVLTRGMQVDPDEHPVLIEYMKGGMKGGIKPVNGEVQLQPLSSFSTNPQIATGYAGGADGGLIMEGIIPREMVLSTARTGFGAVTSSEWVVMGGTGKWQLRMP